MFKIYNLYAYIYTYTYIFKIYIVSNDRSIFCNFPFNISLFIINLLITVAK